MNGKVVINGPLNINHKPIIQLVNFTTRDDLADQKFLLPLQQVGMKIHQVVNSLKDAVVVAAATNRTLGKNTSSLLTDIVDKSAVTNIIVTIEKGLNYCDRF